MTASLKATRPVLGSDYQPFTATQQVIVQRTHGDFNAEIRQWFPPAGAEMGAGVEYRLRA
jgi:hypothetical protein